LFGFVLSALLTVLAVSLLIVAHEFGHLLGARSVGMKVEVFSVGFWKRVVGLRWGETDYRLSLIPFGGYLKVAGEGPDATQGEPYEFWSKSPGQRAVFVLGGVAMNAVLAVALFVVAFAIGVPFTVAEVGETLPGSPAWQAGLKPGDRIVAINGKPAPVFEDITSTVLLGRGPAVHLEVDRAGERLSFTLTPEYEEEAGYKAIGIFWPRDPIITGFQRIGLVDGRCPALEAGLEPGDRVLAVNGRPVTTAADVAREIVNSESTEIELSVQRDGRTLSFTPVAQPVPRHVIGISGVTSTVEMLEGGGVADKLGLQLGDRIVAADGVAVSSYVRLRQALEACDDDEVALQVDRSGSDVSLLVPVPDRASADDFLFGVLFEESAALPWVEPGGPAWEAGLRPGDVVASVAGHHTRSWQDVLDGMEGTNGRPFEVQWRRGSELRAAQVAPRVDPTATGPKVGIIMDHPVADVRRYGVVGAVTRGVSNAAMKIAEVPLILRSFVRRELSPRHMGGIVTIVYVSYRAAHDSIGRLLYTTAIISAALAFFNLLPIPVLDGGHLAFLAIEKARGRRLSERVMGTMQTAGFVLLMALVVYVTWNDVRRLLGLH
jgi:regulator of sigma E protease